MHTATFWKVGPRRIPTVFCFNPLSQVIIPIAFLVDGTGSILTVNERATGETTFQVYALPRCGQDGKDQKTKIYQLPDRVCVNTSPIPKVDAPFLSYRAKINDGVTGSTCLDRNCTGKYSSTCFVDIYPYKNCTGNYAGLQSTPGNANNCQNLLQGFTGLNETYGAKSVIVYCFRVPA